VIDGIFGRYESTAREFPSSWLVWIVIGLPHKQNPTAVIGDNGFLRELNGGHRSPWSVLTSGGYVEDLMLIIH
jgi:hypothetical protein